MFVSLQPFNKTCFDICYTPTFPFMISLIIIFQFWCFLQTFLHYQFFLTSLPRNLLVFWLLYCIHFIWGMIMILWDLSTLLVSLEPIVDCRSSFRFQSTNFSNIIIQIILKNTTSFWLFLSLSELDFSFLILSTTIITRFFSVIFIYWRRR